MSEEKFKSVTGELVEWKTVEEATAAWRAECSQAKCAFFARITAREPETPELVEE
jgi:hypothetical protein